MQSKSIDGNGDCGRGGDVGGDRAVVAMVDAVFQRCGAGSCGSSGGEVVDGGGNAMEAFTAAATTALDICRRRTREGVLALVEILTSPQVI